LFTEKEIAEGQGKKGRFIWQEKSKNSKKATAQKGGGFEGGANREDLWTKILAEETQKKVR